MSPKRDDEERRRGRRRCVEGERERERALFIQPIPPEK
jgi:hypothetical protein